MSDLIAAVREWGVAAVALAVFVWGTMREWWVFGPAHRRALNTCQAQQDRLYAEMTFWRSKALEGVGLAEEAIDLAVKP